MAERESVVKYFDAPTKLPWVSPIVLLEESDVAHAK
jgi:hypothetical protein